MTRDVYCTCVYVYRYLSKQYVYIYINTHSHTYIYIYIYIQESYLPGTKMGLEIQLLLPKKPEVPFFVTLGTLPKKGRVSNRLHVAADADDHKGGGKNGNNCRPRM